MRTRVRDVMTPDRSRSARSRCWSPAADARARRARAARRRCRRPRAGPCRRAALAARYLDETEIAGFQRMPVTVEQLVRALDGELVRATRRPRSPVTCSSAPPSPDARGAHQPGDTVIVGDRLRTQPLALEAGAACLVSTGGYVPATTSRARARRAVRPHRHAARHLHRRAPRLACARRRRPDGHRRAHGRPGDAARRGRRGPHRVPPARGCRRPTKPAGWSASSRAPTSRAARGAGSCSSTTTRSRSPRPASRTPRWSRSSTTTASATSRRRARPVPQPARGSTATIVATRSSSWASRSPQPIAAILLSAVLTDTVLLKSPDHHRHRPAHRCRAGGASRASSRSSSGWRSSARAWRARCSRRRRSWAPTPRSSTPATRWCWSPSTRPWTSTR